MATLKIHCLGGATFYVDGLVSEDLKVRRGQALLCYLAVNKKVFTRSALAGLLWADMPESDARMNLRKTLNRLKAFKPYLVITRETLAINPSASLWLDITEFEAAAAARMDIHRLQHAVSLYQGDFLDGFECDDLPLFYEWASTLRTRLHETILGILKILTEHFTSQQDYPAAILTSRQQLKFEPWHEEAHRSLMRLLALSGQRSAAIKQYETCRRILDEELRVEPAADTLLLYKQIVSGKLAVENTFREALSHHHSPDFLPSLPAQATALIGRARESAELRIYLAEPIIRLVSIVGAGGMGKTHLALSIAHELSAERHLFDGVVFVPLGQVYTHQQFIVAVAGHLNLTLAGAQDPEKLLLENLRDKNFLIILDNFEQLLADVDFLERILAASPYSKLLITSRERLKSLQEWVLDLHGLPYPEDENDIQSIQSDAVHLFVQRAHALRQSFSVEKNLQAVARICKSVQGLPLALELAASWIRVLTAREIADQISQNLCAISANLNNIPERHRTIQAVFDSSWRWLNTEEQHVMSKLSVFTSGFTLQAAGQVAGASVPILASLVDKSFLSRDSRSQDVSRYEVHALVRQYAYTRLQESGKADTAHSLHLEYYLALAEQAEQFWDTPEEKDWLSRLEAERGNLHTALQYALDQELVESLLRLNAALFTFWIYKSPTAEVITWLESTLALSQDETNPTVLRSRAKALNVAGYAAVTAADYTQAQAHFKEGLTIYKHLDDPRGVSWSLRGCGFVAMYRGDFALAQSFVEQSYLICQDMADEWGLAWSVFDLGYLKMAKGEMEQAEIMLEDALEQFRLAGIRFGEYRTLIALGYICYTQQHWTQAGNFYKEALMSQQQNNFFQQIADALEGLAYIAAEAGKDKFAIQLLSAAKNHRDLFGYQRHLFYEADYQHNLDLLHSRLKKEDFTRFWEEGRTLNHQRAAALALAETPG